MLLCKKSGLNTLIFNLSIQIGTPLLKPKSTIEESETKGKIKIKSDWLIGANESRCLQAIENISCKVLQEDPYNSLDKPENRLTQTYLEMQTNTGTSFCD